MHAIGFPLRDCHNDVEA